MRPGAALAALAVVALAAAAWLQAPPLQGAPSSSAGPAPAQTLPAPRPAAATLATAPAVAFDFIALGDMPYGSEMVVGGAYRHLIGLINAERPPFVVHVGDFKDGVSECTDAEFNRQAAYFKSYAGALVYTPGDNDWLDCVRRGADALERLQALRRLFFSQPLSLGQQPMAVERQADRMPVHAAYVENQRWWHQGVLFASFHTLGRYNGSDADNADVRAEAEAREAANVAWITEAFALARQRQAPALVLLTQAEALTHGRPQAEPLVKPGFERSFTQTLLPLAQHAPFPVLLVHGDGHVFKFNQPYQDAQQRPITNLWRLEVFGAAQMHAVTVRVAPGAEPPFVATPLWNPLSPDPRR